MKKLLCLVYEILIFAPLFILSTILVCTFVLVFSPIFGNKFWGYYPCKWWGKFMCIIALSPVKVIGKENIDPNKSYVFVANHQSIFDIFLLFGYLGKNIRWVQKQSIRKIPLVGIASKIAGNVFVDQSSNASRIESIKKAKSELEKGVSIVLFPEGQRTRNGKMGRFKRGAFFIARDMNLDIVPLTLNGPYNLLKIHHRIINPHKIELHIHKPISVENVDNDAMSEVIKNSYDTIHNDLWPQYK